MTDPTPFQLDLREQPAALDRLGAHASEILADARRLADRPWSRIVLSGMGSSDFAAIPTWRRLASAGLPVWTIDSGRLLDSPGVLTADTLLVLTSQSGGSGEVVELLDRLGTDGTASPYVVAISDDASSPLVTAADAWLPLHSGPEATVSTKSYLNTLAVHRALAAAFTGADLDLFAEIVEAREVVARQLETLDLTALTAEAFAGPDRRLAAVGTGDHASTALLAGLITKESSKVAFEGFIGGQFRHGPYELAGAGLTVFLYGADDARRDGTVEGLAADLVAAGSRVVLVGDSTRTDAVTIPAPGSSVLARLASETVVAEFAAVGLAAANGVEPGVFAFGSKVTTAL